MNNVHIAVACRNASGMSDLPVFTVKATSREIALGIHYDKAETLAEEAGYEKPFVCFDAAEQGAILSAARHLDQVPQVVVIDITGRVVHSARCDAGKIKVICYDESDTDEPSEAVAEYPVGIGGQLVWCRAHVRTANVDPGLKKARRDCQRQP